MIGRNCREKNCTCINVCKFMSYFFGATTCSLLLIDSDISHRKNWDTKRQWRRCLGIHRKHPCLGAAFGKLFRYFALTEISSCNTRANSKEWLDCVHIHIIVMCNWKISRSDRFGQGHCDIKDIVMSRTYTYETAPFVEYKEGDLQFLRDKLTKKSLKKDLNMNKRGK